MVFDDSLPESIRDRASRVLEGFDDSVTGEQCRTWWAGGDPVVMRHALRFMTRAEADIVTAVAGDDTHPSQALALRTMSFGYGEAEFVPLLVRALSHGDSRVRRAAIEASFWEEPAAAETGLLAAANDETFEVAEAALEALPYYATQRVLRGVAELRAHPDARIGEAATKAFEDLRETFEDAASEGDPKAVALLRQWMRPVRELVAWPEEITLSERGQPISRQWPAVVPEPGLIALLDNPDTDREELERTLRGVDWTGYDSDERERAAARLTTHPNPLVREIGCAALVDWDRTDDLMRMTGDTSSNVRKSAIYNLSLLPANPAVAELAWRYLPTVTGTAAQEALKAYVAHAEGSATDRLVELVRSDPREAVRYEAIHALGKLRAVREVHGLADLLAEPPGVHWGVHTALLWVLRELELATPLPAQLATVDNLHLQIAIARYTAHQS
ncbi:HEAT repeat domain-containing protein [Nocardia concava]|uniref:HEAT repeat domain-containing protein n=1 Tax=Nocardia concava TaxID=257281 RepID=UPI0012F83EA3|nr:HEAT repeat domain-containing protein [Nocardia concava]